METARPPTRLNFIAPTGGTSTNQYVALRKYHYVEGWFGTSPLCLNI